MWSRQIRTWIDAKTVCLFDNTYNKILYIIKSHNSQNTYIVKNWPEAILFFFRPKIIHVHCLFTSTNISLNTPLTMNCNEWLFCVIWMWFIRWMSLLTIFLSHLHPLFIPLHTFYHQTYAAEKRGLHQNKTTDTNEKKNIESVDYALVVLHTNVILLWRPLINDISHDMREYFQITIERYTKWKNKNLKKKTNERCYLMPEQSTDWNQKAARLSPVCRGIKTALEYLLFFSLPECNKKDNAVNKNEILIR